MIRILERLRIRSWWCRVKGLHYRRWERLPDGTRIFGCVECRTYVLRSTEDVRMGRKVRITKERAHLRGIQGGRIA